MSLIDTHAHLYLEKFRDDLDEVVTEIRAANVEKVCLPDIDPSTTNSLIELTEMYADLCYPMIGMHPCSIDANYRSKLSEVEKNVEKFSGRIIGIGECGMDLYWDKSYKDEQIEALESQIAWAKSLDLPIILHTREATLEVIEVIRRNQDGRLKGIFHCFGDGVEEAHQIIDLGFYLGIGGVVTFKNGGLDKVLPEIDITNLVLETDAPYLAPAPYRGKRNTPAYLTFIAERVAGLMETSTEEVARITSENAKGMFGF